jgi:hypothetical protein
MPYDWVCQVGSGFKALYHHRQGVYCGAMKISCIAGSLSLVCAPHCGVIILSPCLVNVMYLPTPSLQLTTSRHLGWAIVRQREGNAERKQGYWRLSGIPIKSHTRGKTIRPPEHSRCNTALVTTQARESGGVMCTGKAHFPSFTPRVIEGHATWDVSIATIWHGFGSWSWSTHTKAEG